MSMTTAESHGRRRGRPVLAIVGVAAVLLTGCTAAPEDPISTIGGARSGGGASAEPDAPAAADAADAMAAFGRCMRDEGVPIDDGGGTSLRRGGGGDDPDLEAAAARCKKHLEGTGVEFAAGGSGGQLPPEQLEGLLGYAKCMRAHGIDVPDPDPESGGLLTEEGESDLDTESAEYEQADQKCTAELPDAEVTNP